MSATHGDGLPELLDVLRELPSGDYEPEPEPDVVVALVGRPNAGGRPRRGILLERVERSARSRDVRHCFEHMKRQQRITRNAQRATSET